MTVHRHTEEFFNSTPQEVAGAVRYVLACRPPYSHTRETVKEAVFKATVAPYIWYSPTELTIQMQPQYNGTRVIADTKSLWFTLGDIFDLYNSYQQDFLRDLRVELQRIELHRQGRRV